MHEPHVLARHLRRHERRRREGTPTITVLVGEIDATLSVLTLSLSETGTALVRTYNGTREGMAREWTDSLENRGDLAERALAVATRAGPFAAPASQADWDARSVSQRSLWLEQLASSGEPGQRAAALWLIRRLDVDRKHVAGSAIDELRALVAWVSPFEWPALCLVAQEAKALVELIALVQTVPSLPSFAVVSEDLWARELPRLPKRERTMLLTGLTAATSKGELAPAPVRLERNDPPGKTGPDADSIESLRQKATRAAKAAIEAPQGSRDRSEKWESARSYAEALLYELLQRDEDTRGLFVLNGKLPFYFGPREAEIDLLCVALRVAVEVDGYHHFTEAASYRRDRRKDVLLQSQGFLVARYLATDVVELSGEVVRSIRDVVLRRRRSPNQTQRKK